MLVGAFAAATFLTFAPTATVEMMPPFPLRMRLRSASQSLQMIEMGEAEGELIVPCNCQGFLRYVHLACLRKHQYAAARSGSWQYLQILPSFASAARASSEPDVGMNSGRCRGGEVDD